MGVLVQAVFPHKNGQAKDSIVNTFHFDNNDDAEGAADCSAAVKAFYNAGGNTFGAASAVGAMMGGTINRAGAINRCYSTGVPRGTPPLLLDPWTLHAETTGSQVALPAEVAICLSYYANLNVKRRRGRIFLGPLNSQVIEPDVNGRARVHSAARDALKTAALALIADADTFWAVYSPKDYVDDKGVVHPKKPPQEFDEFHLITNGWVDNAFDTQRRRGERADTRTTF